MKNCRQKKVKRQHSSSSSHLNLLPSVSFLKKKKEAKILTNPSIFLSAQEVITMIIIMILSHHQKDNSSLKENIAVQKLKEEVNRQLTHLQNWQHFLEVILMSHCPSYGQ